MEQNKRMRILMCQNSTEGILCGVYEAFTSRYGHAWQKLAVGPYVNGDLFSDIYSVEVNTEKAGKVVKAIISKISEEAWYLVHMASEADSQEKGELLQISYFGLCQWQEGFECDVHTGSDGTASAVKKCLEGDTAFIWFSEISGTSERHSVCQTGFEASCGNVSSGTFSGQAAHGALGDP